MRLPTDGTGVSSGSRRLIGSTSRSRPQSQQYTQSPLGLLSRSSPVRKHRQDNQQEHDDCNLVFAPQKPSKPSQPWDFVVNAVRFGCAPHYGFDIPQSRFQTLPHRRAAFGVVPDAPCRDNFAWTLVSSFRDSRVPRSPGPRVWSLGSTVGRERWPGCSQSVDSANDDGSARLPNRSQFGARRRSR
jgi:hypothetical protein